MKIILISKTPERRRNEVEEAEFKNSEDNFIIMNQSVFFHELVNSKSNELRRSSRLRRKKQKSKDQIGEQLKKLTETMLRVLNNRRVKVIRWANN